MPNGVIGNTTDSGSVKSRFEPWLGNRGTQNEMSKDVSFFYYFFVIPIYFFIKFADDYLSFEGKSHTNFITN